MAVCQRSASALCWPRADLFVCRRIHVTSLDRQRWRITSVGVGETFELGRHPQGIEVKAIVRMPGHRTTPQGACDRGGARSDSPDRRVYRDSITPSAG